ncbi:nuclear mRNA export, poly(A)+RNA binding protein, partial [Spiromyces aspiralis]
MDVDIMDDSESLASQKDALRGYIPSATGKIIDILSMEYDGRFMYVTVPNMTQAKAILGLDKSPFSGKKLSVRMASRPQGRGPSRGQTYEGRRQQPEAGPDRLRSELTKLLDSRAMRAEKRIMLGSLGADPIILALASNPVAPAQIAKFIQAILVLASKLYPEIITLDLSGNSLENLQCIADLGQQFPNLLNLSLMNNQISSFKELDYFSIERSTAPLRHLQQFILSGNPICGLRTSDPARYESEVLARFPSLVSLDEVPFDPVRKNAILASIAAKQRKSEAILPVKQAYTDHDQTKAICESFFAMFFKAYDDNRDSLVHVYAPDAKFSVNADTFALPDQLARPRLTSYITIGRNLLKIKDPERQKAHLYCGNTAIINKLHELPRSLHPLNNGEKFAFDGWQSEIIGPSNSCEVVIIAQVHGEFMDVQLGQNLSFSRAFVLSPVPPGS